MRVVSRAEDSGSVGGKEQPDYDSCLRKRRVVNLGKRRDRKIIQTRTAHCEAEEEKPAEKYRQTEQQTQTASPFLKRWIRFLNVGQFNTAKSDYKTCDYNQSESAAQHQGISPVETCSNQHNDNRGSYGTQLSTERVN